MNSIIFSILFILIEKKKVSRAYLCDKFEISSRTVSRYIDILIESGIPVLSNPGVGGGYTLPDDYKLERTFLTEKERIRLISLLNSTSKNFNDNTNTLLLEKLNSFHITKEFSLNKENLIIDAGPWGSPHLYKNKIDTINNALNSKKTLLIKYIDRHEFQTERSIDPYNLVLKQGIWYLYGWCHEREDYRLFKLSRISYMVITNKNFEFRTDAKVHEKLNVQFDDGDEVSFIIEFYSIIRDEIEEWLGADAIYEVGLNLRAEATLYGGNRELIAKILSFGSSVKIISPAALREEILIECRRILENT